jgi:inner membrane protein
VGRIFTDKIAVAGAQAVEHAHRPVDNVTSLAGITLPSDDAARRWAERRLAAGAGLIAANLPDIDIFYAPITPPPLGYLLHHRGHTHTVAGIVVLALVLIEMYRRLPPLSRWRFRDRARLSGLIAIALASHLLLDALNSYGTHPAIRLIRLGTATPFSSSSRGCGLLLDCGCVERARQNPASPRSFHPDFPVVMASAGIVPLEAVVALAVAGVPFAVLVRGSSAPVRAAVALTACALVVVAFAMSSRAARRATLAAVAPGIKGRIIDVVLTPNPSSPMCWSAIAIELDESNGEYVLWRGTSSLAPRWKSPTSCACIASASRGIRGCSAPAHSR